MQINKDLKTGAMVGYSIEYTDIAANNAFIQDFMKFAASQTIKQHKPQKSKHDTPIQHVKTQKTSTLQQTSIPQTPLTIQQQEDHRDTKSITQTVTNMQSKTRGDEHEIQGEGGIKIPVPRDQHGDDRNNRRRLAITQITEDELKKSMDDEDGAYGGIGALYWDGSTLESNDFGVATASVIKIVDKTKEKGKYVYAIAAAHDIIELEGEEEEKILKMLDMDQWSFYSGFGVIEEIKRKNLHQIRKQVATKLVSVWIIDDWGHSRGDQSHFQSDMAIFKFDAGQEFDVPVLGFNVKDDFPINTDDYLPIKNKKEDDDSSEENEPEPIKLEMTMIYTTGLNSMNNEREYKLSKQNIPTYYISGRYSQTTLFTNGVPLHGGFCGAPYIDLNGYGQSKNMVGMFVAAFTDPKSKYAEYCHKGGTNSKCIGIAARITEERKEAIQMILNTDPVLANNKYPGWMDLDAMRIIADYVTKPERGLFI